MLFDMTPGRAFTPKSLVAILAALLLAVLAFSQAAASIGLTIESFRPLGAGFFSTRSGQMQVARGMYGEGERISSATALRVGREALIATPLNPRSLWLVGMGMEMQGRPQKARRAMQQAARLSRRDRAVQLWLGMDNVRHGAIEQGLGNFDLLLRTDAEIASMLMPRIAAMIQSREGRRYILPYIRENNPWLLTLLQATVRDLPSPTPTAALLIERGIKAPDIRYMRAVYASLVRKLVEEGSYSLVLQLYPLLPGTNADSVHTIGGITDNGTDDGYPPFIWSFSESDARGAAFVRAEGGGVGLDIFGAPGTVGVAASKIVAPGRKRALRWQVADRTGNFEATAQWAVTCLAGESAGTVEQSINMLADSVPLNRALVMPIPDNCLLLRLDLRISGGIGRTASNLIVTGFELIDRAPGR